MGVFLPVGYHIAVPTLLLTGSTHTFQVALMGKNYTGATMASMLTDYQTNLSTTGCPLAPSQMYIGWQFSSLKLSSNIGGTLFVSESFPAINGTKTGSLGAPCNVSILTKKPTGIAGRHYRGRCMWPDLWIAEANIGQNGIIDSTGLALAQGLFNQWHTNILATGIIPVLGHSSSEIIPTIQNGSMQVVSKVGTIKRRLRGSS